MKCTNEAAHTGCKQDFTQGFYQNKRKELIWPIEVSVFINNILCMSVLIRTKDSLKDLRDNFRRDVFDRITKNDSNFLFKISFYLLKYIHLIVLPSIFLFSITGINLYFIGLLYFSMRYISSLQAYRKSGPILLVFTSFFIWIKYLWEYARDGFTASYGKEYSDIVKALDMLTFSEIKSPKIDPGKSDPNADFNDNIK
jgi:hypothetical protein